jgi:hypothetical protein
MTGPAGPLRDRRPFLLPAILGLALSPAWLALAFASALDPGDFGAILRSPAVVLLALVAAMPVLPVLGWLMARRWPFGLAALAALPLLPIWPLLVADALGGSAGPASTALLLLAPVWAFIVLRAAFARPRSGG